MTAIDYIISRIDKYTSNDLEQFLLLFKDLANSSDSFAQASFSRFLSTCLSTHPRLMSLQGDRLFKIVRLAKVQDETKLKMFKNYIALCADFISPCKGFIKIVHYFLTHSNPKVVKETFDILTEFQGIRRKGTGEIINEALLILLLAKMQFNVFF